jgi:hypothetical protein
MFIFSIPAKQGSSAVARQIVIPESHASLCLGYGCLQLVLRGVYFRRVVGKYLEVGHEISLPRCLQCTVHEHPLISASFNNLAINSRRDMNSRSYTSDVMNVKLLVGYGRHIVLQSSLSALTDMVINTTHTAFRQDPISAKLQVILNDRASWFSSLYPGKVPDVTLKQATSASF